MIRIDNRDNAAVRPLKVKWRYLKHETASVLWQRGQTKILASIALIADDDNLNYEGNLTPVHETWLTQILTPLLTLSCLKEQGLLVKVVILENDGSLLSEITNAVLASLRLLPEGLVQKQATAVTVGYVSQESIIDLELSEMLAAKQLLTQVVTLDGDIVAQSVNGTQVLSKSQFNQLYLLADQGQALTQAQVDASFQQAVKPTVQTSHLDNTIVIATNNQGKADEFRALFQAAGYQIKTLADFPNLPEIKETGQTFLENATLKAEQIADILNLPVLADDSGLMVDALNGRPGVYSARFAGDHNDAANNAKLLYELTDVPSNERTAVFHTTLVFAKPQRQQNNLVVQGQLEGRILGIPRGDNGFGYDPLFYVPESDQTLAEMTLAQKNKISHRAQAIKNLAPIWQAWYQQTDKEK